MIGTRPQPPPLFNTPASTYSTPATGELPPYIHRRGCIQPLPPSFRYHPLAADPLSSLSLSLCPPSAASLVTRGRSISLWRAPLSFPFAPFVCLRVVLPFRVNVNGARRVIHRSSTYSCPRLVHPPETATKTAGPLSSARCVWTRKPPPRRRRGRGRGRGTGGTHVGKPEGRKMHFRDPMIEAVLSIAMRPPAYPLSSISIQIPIPNRERRRERGWEREKRLDSTRGSSWIGTDRRKTNRSIS